MRTIGRLWSRARGPWVDVLPALLYAAALFWFGLIPLKRLPGPEFALADKVWHAAAFAGLALLLVRVALFLGRPARSAALIGAASAALLGGVLEVLQSFTRYRSADWADFVADALGAAVAFTFLRVVRGGTSAEEG